MTECIHVHVHVCYLPSERLTFHVFSIVGAHEQQQQKHECKDMTFLLSIT